MIQLFISKSEINQSSNIKRKKPLSVSIQLISILKLSYQYYLKHQDELFQIDNFCKRKYLIVILYINKIGKMAIVLEN